MIQRHPALYASAVALLLWTLLGLVFAAPHTQFAFTFPATYVPSLSKSTKTITVKTTITADVPNSIPGNETASTYFTFVCDHPAIISVTPDSGGPSGSSVTTISGV